MRIEKDSIGEMKIAKNSYTGIHTERAKENFKNSRNSVNIELIYGIVIVKKAAVEANFKSGKISKEKKRDDNLCM